jgi:hypothetical protein
MTVQPQLAALAGIFVLAFLAETLTEYFLRPWIRPEHPESSHMADDEDLGAARVLPPLALRYAAAVVGVVLAVIYRVDLLAMIGLAPLYPIVGYLITGLIVGRGSNFVHDFADRWLDQ